MLSWKTSLKTKLFRLKKFLSCYVFVKTVIHDTLENFRETRKNDDRWYYHYDLER